MSTVSEEEGRGDGDRVSKRRNAKRTPCERTMKKDTAVAAAAWQESAQRIRHNASLSAGIPSGSDLALEEVWDGARLRTSCGRPFHKTVSGDVLAEYVFATIFVGFINAMLIKTDVSEPT